MQPASCLSINVDLVQMAETHVDVEIQPDPHNLI